jgi:hypothetical protein
VAQAADADRASTFPATTNGMVTWDRRPTLSSVARSVAASGGSSSSREITTGWPARARPISHG